MVAYKQSDIFSAMDHWILECGTGSARAMLLKTAPTFGQAKKDRKKGGGGVREDKMQTVKLSMVKTHFKLKKPHHNVHANVC